MIGHMTPASSPCGLDLVFPDRFEHSHYELWRCYLRTSTSKGGDILCGLTQLSWMRLHHVVKVFGAAGVSIVSDDAIPLVVDGLHGDQCE